MLEQRSFLIVGNGIAGVTAAEILRDEDAAADISVVADDPFPVYYRPALKDYLGGKLREDKLWARPISFYQDRQIHFLNDRVVGLEAGSHRVLLRSGQVLNYSRLLLAHGARASTLTCSGLDLLGVTTLRTVADYQKVLSHLNNVRRVVVTGSGTLALESIETLRHRGFQVTHLLRRRSLWSDVLDPIASDLVLQQEQRDGVDVRYEQEIAEIVGQHGSVQGIITTTGVNIPCEAVLLGIGIEPNIDFVKSAGVTCGRGVKVDGGMRTNIPDVYAAGDLVETTDPITGRSRVIGQWFPSIQQARAAAYSMLDILDNRHQFHFGNFYNASMLYGLEFASVGLSSIPKDGKGYQEIVADPQPRTYQKVILKDGVPVGMLALGNRKSVLTYKRAIDARIDLSPVAARLFAPDFILGKWLDAQGVPPPILGVNRDGAMIINKAVNEVRPVTSVTPAIPASNKSQEITEAILVPVAPPEIKSALKETYLSQTKVVTIGRAEGVNLPVRHGSISRRHAEIVFANGQYVLRDVQSKNGTFVNGQRLDADSVSLLKPGDMLRFGDVTFAFQTRTVDPSASMLLVRRSLPILSKRATQTPDSEKALPLETEPPSKTSLLRNAPQPQAASPLPSSALEQPVLNADGSMLFPGAITALPAAMVDRMKDAPALVALILGSPVLFLLKQGARVTIGRDKSNQVVLPDISVSRLHAEIFPGPDGIFIRDLESSNGVMVNQAKIDNPYQLSNGDRISVGNVVAYYIDQRPQQIKVPHVPQNNMPNANSSPAPGKHCHHCGSLNNNIARFCHICGAPLQNEGAPKSRSENRI